MKSHLLAVVLLLALPVLQAGLAQCAPLDPGTPASIGDIRFVADVAGIPKLGGGSSVEITYTVTHDALVFLRHADGYRARYEVTVILYDGRGRQAAGDSWPRTIQVQTYDATNSRRLSAQETLTIDVDPGTYRLKISIRSLDTRAFGLIERRIDVPEAEAGTLTLGTMIFESPVPDTLASEQKLVQNPTRRYGEDHPIAHVRVPIYGDPGVRYRLDLSVETEEGLVQSSSSDTVTQLDWRTEYVHEFSVLSLEVGSYVMRASVRPLADGDTHTTRARFRVVTSPKSWGEDFDRMIAQISYVATMEEVGRLEKAAPEDREKAWDEFWLARDPDPSTEENEFKIEFLRRLGYANTQFRSLVEGWQTDMGRIYIQHGEPDDIESQPLGRMLHAWETWYYYREHIKFVFVDREGFGEFDLVEASRI
jgi:GWxTD domain-containing protein